LRQQRDLGLIHYLADDQQPIAIGRGAQQLQSFFTQSLEAVGRAARLEGAAPDYFRACAGDDLGDLVDLVFVLDAARAGHDDNALAADLQSAYLDDRTSGTEAAAGQFVRGRDAMSTLYAIEHFKLGRIEIARADAAE